MFPKPMNAIFIFSTPWAYERIHEVRTAGLQMTPFVPNASLDLKDAITHSLSGGSLAYLHLGH